ncbi:MAG: glycosyltransferase family 8 protein [Elusimicrobiales bacterium]|nr:glycosyltransferase family 8 protein [Elusimicrobiales bacterium]
MHGQEKKVSDNAKNSRINICLASDDRYVPYMGIAIFSILKSSQPDDSFRFYILDNGISEEGKRQLESLSVLCRPFEIEFVKIDTEKLSNCSFQEKRLTPAIFCRYFIPEYIKEDKVLYLDCDTMSRSSLAELWNIDLEDNYLAGTLDYHVMKNGKLDGLFCGGLDLSEYINSGVLLINCKKWREDDIPAKMMDLTIKNGSMLKFPDQDIINYVCRGKKKIISHSWNVMGFLYKPDLFCGRPDFAEIISQRENCRIRHFQPWRKNWFMPHKEEYLALMAESPWKELIPDDDDKKTVLKKNIFRYFWKHPFCLAKPSFYRQWKMRGTECMFNGW